MGTYPLLLHPSRYVWDFWTHHDAQADVFHVLYLNAERSLVAAGQHHLHSQVGYARTRDFSSIAWIDDAVFAANSHGWDNTSIWTGDVVRQRDVYVLLYTSRDGTLDDGMTQSIGMARSDDLVRWRRDPNVRLQADARWYEPRSRAGDATIHAFRDPFLLRAPEGWEALVSAKAVGLPLGRNGAIARLKASADLRTWTALPPSYAPGWFGECEVPQTFGDASGERWLAFSCWGRHVHAPSSRGRGGLFLVREGGAELELLVPEATGLYACRILPELAGDVVGFDVESGGLRRLGIGTGLRALR